MKYTTKYDPNYYTQLKFRVNSYVCQHLYQRGLSVQTACLHELYPGKIPLSRQWQYAQMFQKREKVKFHFKRFEAPYSHLFWNTGTLIEKLNTLYFSVIH